MWWSCRVPAVEIWEKTSGVIIPPHKNMTLQDQQKPVQAFQSADLHSRPYPTRESGEVPLYKEGFSPLGPTYILPHLLIVGLTLPSTATALYETKTQSPAKEEIISGVTKMLVMPLLAVIHRPVDQFLSKPFV